MLRLLQTFLLFSNSFVSNSCNYLLIHWQHRVLVAQTDFNIEIETCFFAFQNRLDVILLFLPAVFPNEGEYGVLFDLSDLTPFLCSTISLRTINLISMNDGSKNSFSPVECHRLYF